MTNLYWPVYKNIENEVIELSNQVHFDDNQLSIYSVKISELLIRCSVEIEAISKKLFFKIGGIMPSDGDLYFDTHCIQLLEEKWLLNKKKLIVSATNFYFKEEENIILTPLHKANRRGASGSDWKKAYQAVKHDRANNLEKGNIGNLLRALGALFILNIYFKNEIYNVEKDGNATNFPVNMGSNIFSIKLHKWSHYDVEFNYEKSNDFDECIYFTKYTDDSIEKIKKAQQEMNKRKVELFLSHSKLLEYLKSNNISNYEVNDLMWDILGKDDYIRLINIAGQDFFKIMENSKYEAILNKNYV